MIAGKCREEKFLRTLMHISEKWPFNQNEYFFISLNCFKQNYRIWRLMYLSSLLTIFVISCIASKNITMKEKNHKNKAKQKNAENWKQTSKPPWGAWKLIKLYSEFWEKNKITQGKVLYKVILTVLFRISSGIVLQPYYILVSWSPTFTKCSKHLPCRCIETRKISTRLMQSVWTIKTSSTSHTHHS